MPIDLIAGLPPNQTRDLNGAIGGTEGYTPHMDYAERLREKMNASFEMVRNNLRKEMTRQKKHYDKASKGHHLYNVGDAVWLYAPTRKVGLSPKLRPTWDGPYIVTAKLNDVNYRIQKNVKFKPKVVHADRLKLYAGPHDASWWKGPSQPGHTQHRADASVQCHMPLNSGDVRTAPDYPLGESRDVAKAPAKRTPVSTGHGTNPGQQRYNLRSRPKSE